MLIIGTTCDGEEVVMDKSPCQPSKDQGHKFVFVYD